MSFKFENDSHDLVKDLETLYRDSSTADVTFIVEGLKLGAHTSIIGCRSSVFAKMLDHDMLEKGTRRIQITDADFQVFDAFLLYLYTAQIKNEDWETVYSLYSLAAKYDASSLKHKCSHWLGKNISLETVCKCCALAELHGDQLLKQITKLFMREHLNETLQTTDWQIIVSDDSQLASEVLSFATSRMQHAPFLSF
ncbi:protein roadkill [Nephila pilipes]|uniref:Protein roadkill n=1 Tax=Nephila pilipes TaxID=299642 RepID=A0A8X6IGX9_NEPPI|nr:protein roadkill [Nephila pilipes]